MTVVTNIAQDGQFSLHLGPTFLLWYSDGCYLETPPIYSFSYAEQVPHIGGNTSFINAQRAYEITVNKTSIFIRINIS